MTKGPALTETQSRLQGTVLDAVSGKPVPCWVEIRCPDGTVLNDWAVADAWHGFPCNGSFKVEVPPVPLQVFIRFPLSHESIDAHVLPEAGRVVERTWSVRPWVPLSALNMVAGESHNHISDRYTPEQAALYAEAFGLRYLNICQGWMKNPNSSTQPSGVEIAQHLQAASSSSVSLHFGAERPKTRYGHVWWLNLPPFDDPFGEYAGWHDSSYVNRVKESGSDSSDLQETCPLQMEPPLEIWRHYRSQGAACVAAHPTSWWLERPDDELVVTNISAELPYALLSGYGPDALVVMGYDPDQIFYQNLWFHLLNEGYQLAGCGETDGSLRGAHHIGQIVTHTALAEGESYTPEALVRALREGRSVMSSGPFIHFSADDGGIRMGDSVEANGSRHLLRVEAWSASDPNEALTWAILYRNGKPWQVRDLREQPLRHFVWNVEVSETEYAWYLVKAYGRDGPPDVSCLDVMAYARLCETTVDVRYQDWKQVALTNPIYFTPPNWAPPVPLECRMNVQVVDQAGVPQAQRSFVLRDGDCEPVTMETDAEGRWQGTVSPLALIEIDGADGKTITRSIFLDYRPVNACMEYAFTGRWRKQHPCLQPGQVPWEAFGFNELCQKLDDVDWVLCIR